MSIYNFDPTQQFVSPSIPDFRPESSQLNPQQSVYDPNNPDMAQAEAYALENIRISGAWVTVIPRSEDNKFDKTWNEDSDPTYYTGYDFKAFFAPPAPEIMLTKFGIDGANKFDITFSRSEVYGVFGERMLRNGDVVIIPHNSLVLKATRFKVLHAQDTGNYRYRWMYLTCTVENMNKDESLIPRNI
jgi:hypothetical protein